MSSYSLKNHLWTLYLQGEGLSGNLEVTPWGYWGMSVYISTNGKK